MSTTTVRGHWRKNPKTGKPIWVHQHQRRLKDRTKDWKQPKNKDRVISSLFNNFLLMKEKANADKYVENDIQFGLHDPKTASAYGRYRLLVDLRSSNPQSLEDARRFLRKAKVNPQLNMEKVIGWDNNDFLNSYMDEASKLLSYMERADWYEDDASKGLSRMSIVGSLENLDKIARSRLSPVGRQLSPREFGYYQGYLDAVSSMKTAVYDTRKDANDVYASDPLATWQHIHSLPLEKMSKSGTPFATPAARAYYIGLGDAKADFLSMFKKQFDNDRI